jgi:uncharacterized membrane protein
VWITWSATYIISPTDFRFSEQGIVIEKFGKRTQIPWEHIVQVRRDPLNTSIFVDMQTLTRYEKLIVGRFSISLMQLHYREADALIREKVGSRYKRL